MLRPLLRLAPGLVARSRSASLPFAGTLALSARWLSSDAPAQNGVTKNRKYIAANTSSANLTVHAFATAEAYDLSTLKSAIIRNNYQFSLMKIPDELKGNVIRIAERPGTGEDEASPFKSEAYVFAEGTMVCWNMSSERMAALLDLVKLVEKEPYDAQLVATEREVMEFDTKEGYSRLEGGRIYIDSFHDHTLMDRFAFSDGMALSVQLAMFESRLRTYVEHMEAFPQALSSGTRLTISPGEVQRKIGELLMLRHKINLVSDHADVYWDRPQAEHLFARTCRFLDVPARRAAMNQRLTYCSELTELLRTILSEKQSRKLEWYIIFLIAVEVVFGLVNEVEKFM